MYNPNLGTISCDSCGAPLRVRRYETYRAMWFRAYDAGWRSYAPADHSCPSCEGGPEAQGSH